MPDLNDFYAFNNTTDDSGGSGGAGGSGSIFLWALAIVIILYIIGKLFG